MISKDFPGETGSFEYSTEVHPQDVTASSMTSIFLPILYKVKIQDWDFSEEKLPISIEDFGNVVSVCKIPETVTSFLFKTIPLYKSLTFLL